MIELPMVATVPMRYIPGWYLKAAEDARVMALLFPPHRQGCICPECKKDK